jgi:hypothetical protein
MGKAIEMSVRLDRVLLDQIAGRWQLLILDALCDRGRKARFNVLRRAIPGISQKTLTQCLRQPERSGLVIESGNFVDFASASVRALHDVFSRQSVVRKSGRESLHTQFREFEFQTG